VNLPKRIKALRVKKKLFRGVAGRAHPERRFRLGLPEAGGGFENDYHKPVKKIFPQGDGRLKGSKKGDALSKDKKPKFSTNGRTY